MSVLSTVKEILEASNQSPGHQTGKEQSEGAYWCHDCGERILDLDAEGDQPACPSCGEAMEFERSTGTTGCAC